MATLIQPGLSSLIDPLFAEADAAEDARWPATAGDRADYRQYYGELKDQPLPNSCATGNFSICWRGPSRAEHRRVRNVVWHFDATFAAALRDNGGGRLIGSEFGASKIVRARENLAAGGLSDLVEIREGDALETLARDLPDTIDFVLLDGAKMLY